MFYLVKFWLHVIGSKISVNNEGNFINLRIQNLIINLDETNELKISKRFLNDQSHAIFDDTSSMQS